MNLYVKNLSCINIFILVVHDGDFTKNNVNSVEDQANKTHKNEKVTLMTIDRRVSVITI